MEYIGKSAFRNCSKLESLCISEGVATIENSAFVDCSSITEVNIPDSVTLINDSAFKNCSSVEKVHIGKGITAIQRSGYIKPNYISTNVFNGCYAIKELEIPMINTDTYSFNSATSIISMVDLFNNTDSEKALDGYSLEKIIITGDATEIPENEFRCMGGVKEIHLPGTVNSVGDYAFTGCTDLTDVYYDDTNIKWEKVAISKGNDPLKNATMHFKDVIRIVGTNETDLESLEQFRGNGDIDNDGVTDLNDLVNLSMYLLRDIKLTEGALIYADTTKDGEVDIADLATLKQIIMHAI